MKIILLTVNKTKDHNIKNLLNDYELRINHYIKFSTINISENKNIKKLSPKEQKEKEGILIQKELQNGDLCILLDEGGVLLNSNEFAEYLNKKYNANYKRIVFVIGGAYGFSKSIYLLKHQKLSLSKMTFTHQMTRLFFCEQMYRAHTILKNEKYHHI
ncbi:MAG: 23S rRNA (pseudouridine(1915)-N(3))-methyltransferase RlmH [Flavobacteriaceae bacterium]|nr:23S rRNA (pseudouridine(1915)-N(3))-methyltransferase RlmH [Flavobacteriaceae bacterium]